VTEGKYFSRFLENSLFAARNIFHVGEDPCPFASMLFGLLPEMVARSPSMGTPFFQQASLRDNSLPQKFSKVAREKILIRAQSSFSYVPEDTFSFPYTQDKIAIPRTTMMSPPNRYVLS
jgi:hypothetical protein